MRTNPEPTAFTEIVRVVSDKLGLNELVMVGDRGMITKARVEELKELNDDPDTEANLGWISKLDKGDFFGRDALLEEKREGLRKKLIGFEMLDRAIARDNYPVYAALAVPEIWRYDGQEMTIYHVQEADYVSAETSRALPMLSSRVLTEYLKRMQEDGEFNAILAFDEWLQSLPR